MQEFREFWAYYGSQILITVFVLTAIFLSVSALASHDSSHRAKALSRAKRECTALYGEYNEEHSLCLRPRSIIFSGDYP